MRCELRTEMTCELTKMRRELQTKMRCEIWIEIRCELWTEIRCELRTEIRCELRTEMTCELRTEMTRELRTKMTRELQPEWHVNYSRNKMWITNGNLFQIPRTVKYFEVSFLKLEFITSVLVEKRTNTNSDYNVAYFKNTNCDSMDNSSWHEMLIADML